MDATEVQDLGKRLSTTADSFGAIARQLDALVGKLPSVWNGPDASRFATEWNQHHSALTAAQNRLTDVSQRVLHNVDDQNQTSSASGASVSTGSPVAAAPAASTAPPAAPTSVGDNAARVRTFADNWNGKSIDYDGAYGNQCFDVFRQYSKDVVGNGNIAVGGSIKAADIYNHYNSNGVAQYYDRIPAGQGQPQPGDVIVYAGTAGNEYGHVAVITSVNGPEYTVLQQSGTTPDKPAWEQTYSLTGTDTSPILGYLRPKS